MANSYKTNTEISDDVHKKWGDELKRVRNDTTRTDAWKKQRLASIWRDMKAEQDKQVEQRDEAKRDHQIVLEQRLFGVGGIAGDSASLMISRRDAGDRASKLESQAQAQGLLDRATRIGDEPLARAIAERAFEMRWVDVTNNFLAIRPDLGDPMNELWDQHAPNLAEEVIGAFSLAVKPAELANMSDYAINALADSPVQGVDA